MNRRLVISVVMDFLGHRSRKQQVGQRRRGCALARLPNRSARAPGHARSEHISAEHKRQWRSASGPTTASSPRSEAGSFPLAGYESAALTTELPTLGSHYDLRTRDSDHSLSSSRSAGSVQRRPGRRHPRDRDPVRRAAHIVETDGVEELDARGVATVLPTNPKLELGLGRTTALYRNLDQLTDAVGVDRL